MYVEVGGGVPVGVRVADDETVAVLDGVEAGVPVLDAVFDAVGVWEPDGVIDAVTEEEAATRGVHAHACERMCVCACWAWGATGAGLGTHP